METVTEETTRLTRVRSFVERHKVGIAIAATSAVALALQVRTANKFNEFLVEKDLYDEFYYSEDEE